MINKADHTNTFRIKNKLKQPTSQSSAAEATERFGFKKGRGRLQIQTHSISGSFQKTSDLTVQAILYRFGTSDTSSFRHNGKS